jgi:hypothetical protein
MSQSSKQTRELDAYNVTFGRGCCLIAVRRELFLRPDNRAIELHLQSC